MTLRTATMVDTSPAPTTSPVSPAALLCDSVAARELRAVRTAEIADALARGPEPEADARLREELVTLHIRVATSIASRYRFRGVAAEDLDQVACLALTKAARRFDPTQGSEFLAFCVPTIRGEVRRYFRDQGWMVRPPRRIQELQQRMNQVEGELSARLGRSPSPAELAAELAEPLTDVLEARNARGCFTPTSLDGAVDGSEDGGTSVGELVGGRDPHESSIEARVALAPAVRRLSERDRDILRLRFYEGLSQREIGERIGVTQMQVSRLLTRIYQELRDELGSIDDAEGSTASCSA
jgi:RNA polymerase sigma-B factor